MEGRGAMGMLASFLHSLHFSLLADHFGVGTHILVGGFHRLLEKRHLAALRPDQSPGRGFVAKGPLYSFGHQAGFAASDKPNSLSHVKEPFHFVGAEKKRILF